MNQLIPSSSVRSLPIGKPNTEKKKKKKKKKNTAIVIDRPTQQPKEKT